MLFWCVFYISSFTTCCGLGKDEWLSNSITSNKNAEVGSLHASKITCVKRTSHSWKLPVRYAVQQAPIPPIYLFTSASNPCPSHVRSRKLVSNDSFLLECSSHNMYPVSAIHLSSKHADDNRRNPTSTYASFVWSGGKGYGVVMLMVVVIEKQDTDPE